jgi:hypothetical protein
MYKTNKWYVSVYDSFYSRKLAESGTKQTGLEEGDFAK